MKAEEEVGTRARGGRWAPALREVGGIVHARISAMQHRQGSAGSVALLAQLRHAVGKQPGSDPAVWEITIAGLPGHADGDEPSPQEWATHTALTLYAIHQQARTEPVHVRGWGLGQAVRKLGDGSVDGPARRRLDAVATASTFNEATHHLRGIVSQLRSAKIPLDYGQLADDLQQFQSPRTIDVVRRRWGRQLYRLSDNDIAPTTSVAAGQQETGAPTQETS